MRVSGGRPRGEAGGGGTSRAGQRGDESKPQLPQGGGDGAGASDGRVGRWGSALLLPDARAGRYSRDAHLSDEAAARGGGCRGDARRPPCASACRNRGWAVPVARLAAAAKKDRRAVAAVGADLHPTGPQRVPRSRPEGGSVRAKWGLRVPRWADGRAGMRGRSTFTVHCVAVVNDKILSHVIRV